MTYRRDIYCKSCKKIWHKNFTDIVDEFDYLMGIGKYKNQKRFCSSKGRLQHNIIIKKGVTNVSIMDS